MRKAVGVTLVVAFLAVASPAGAAKKPGAATCRTHRQALEVASEVFYAKKARYGTEDELVKAKLLKRASPYFSVKLLAGGSDFVVAAVKKSGCL